MSQQLQKTQNLNRDTRILLSKAGKALAQASVKQVEKEVVIKQLNAQLEVLKPQKPRKRVRVDPERRFAEVEQIRAAQVEAAHAQARKNTKQIALVAKSIATQATECIIEDTIVVRPLGS
jgi:hypothetical protein